jgi:predicted negative regulator of RcsB-dependent stress response
VAYYDLEEQEQISELKDWWKHWGALTLATVAIALTCVAAYVGWKSYKTSVATKASIMYAAVTQAEQARDRKKVVDTASALIEQYPRSGYAPLAALVAARFNFEAQDLPATKSSLQWVIDNSRDDDLKRVAKFRLAGVLLDEKQFDQALQLLDAKPEDTMANLYADLRGDILTAKGSVAEARSAYQTALEKTDSKSPYRNLIQLKIDALGGGK